MADKQAVLGSGAKFTGKITNAKSIEINGIVQADLATEKVTIGTTGNFKGAVKSDLVVIAGEYEGKMKADSIWLTESSRISGEIQYKSLQMDRGAALNCRVVHNWDQKKEQAKNRNQFHHNYSSATCALIFFLPTVSRISIVVAEIIAHVTTVP